MDVLGHHTTFAHDSAGRLTSLTDSANNVAQYSYFGGDLATKTDPLGHVTSEFRDPVGRLTAVADALGQTTRFQFDVLNRVQQVTDPQGNVSSYTYDANGNSLSLTDANGHTTTYTYDNLDRRATRIDALLRQETYTYDLNGNISTVTDRKGQVTAFTYDALNRLVTACFNRVVDGGITTCDSTTSYQYDLANRRTTITDSQSGVITETFDDLGRLLSETNPQGSVSYTYDAGGRVATKTVAGQTPFTYSYNATQLLSITQGTKSVQFTYDSAGRPATVTLPNGIVAAYGYDAGSHLTGITYSLNQVPIGNLTYFYDALNRRIGVGGSMARTIMPPTLTSATYDAANQVATLNGAAFTYDPNGNLTHDGQNTYSWDTRGHLAGITGAMSASFSYDAFGRRTAKTLGSSGQSFIYDGDGITQELSGGNVTASLWSGGSNGFVQRTDASGTMVPLTDVQGSVIALSDASGNLLTQYSYDPFGNTTATGLASGNEFQYIGRENDQNGLYYLHARYYSPAMGRFISEDPLGFAGDDVNLHAYTFGSPANLRDPNGTNPYVAGCAIGGLMDVSTNLITDYWTGRKTSWTDIFSLATLRYASEGCKSGLEGAIFGEFILAPIIDMAAPYVARLFADEAGAAFENALGDICELCFPDGTPVWTKKGKVAIEKIKVGDEVLSRNMQTGKLEYKKVTRLITPHQDKLIELLIAGETAVLRPTPSHPFFVKRAATTQGDWSRLLRLRWAIRF